MLQVCVFPTGSATATANLDFCFFQMQKHWAAGLGSQFKWNLITVLEFTTRNNTVQLKLKAWVTLLTRNLCWTLICTCRVQAWLSIHETAFWGFWSRWCNLRKMESVLSSLQLGCRGIIYDTWKLLNSLSLEVKIYPLSIKTVRSVKHFLTDRETMAALVSLTSVTYNGL